MKIIGVFIRMLLAFFILFLILTAFYARVYLQSFVLLLAFILLIYWPRDWVKQKWGKFFANFGRLVLVVVLIVIFQILSTNTSKTSIYRTESHKQRVLAMYDQKLDYWPVSFERVYLDTKYGTVHLLISGPDTAKPVLLFHAAAMGAISWADNVKPLVKKYKVFAVDNPGEGGPSELNNPLIFPQDGEELADLYANIASQLGIESSPVIAASNGGFIAMNYAFYYPEKVESLILLGPMGLTQLSGKSIMMISLPSMLPVKPLRKYVTKWAIGDDLYVQERFGDWFDLILQSMFSSVAQPVPLTTEQKKTIELPVLLFLGTEDEIVGAAEDAEKMAVDFPNIQIHTLESGHLIGLQKAKEVNPTIIDFLQSTQQ